jgi:hypothetical protein
VSNRKKGKTSPRLFLKIVFPAIVIIAILVTGILMYRSSCPEINGISRGMDIVELYSIFPKTEERTYRVDGIEEWHTFNYNDNKFITFLISDGKVINWKINFREEVVEEYLGEFCTQTFIKGFPDVYKAIKDVLMRVPKDVFLELTDRAYPIVFTEYHTKGMGRFANSANIIVLEDDPPTFTSGFYMVKLSTELCETGSKDAISAVVAHELAHRYLDHGKGGMHSAQNERETNALIIEWGFEKEFKAAQKAFGADR